MTQEQIEQRAKDEWVKTDIPGNCNPTIESVMWEGWRRAFQIALSDTPVQEERWATDDDLQHVWDIAIGAEWDKENGYYTPTLEEVIKELKEGESK